MIRFANESDIDNIVSMIADDCKEMEFPFNRQYIADQINSMVSNKCLLFVHEKGGVIGALLAPNMFDPEIYEMRVFIWYASIELTNLSRARVMIQLLDHLLSITAEKRLDVHVSLPNRGKGAAMKDILEVRKFNAEEIYYILRG